MRIWVCGGWDGVFSFFFLKKKKKGAKKLFFLFGIGMSVAEVDV